MKHTLILTSAVALFVLNSCNEPETTAERENVTPVPTLGKYFTEEEIADAQDIHIARTAAKPGEEITLKGKVMGREKVFVQGRASFLIGDPKKLTPCNDIPGDSCPTPWDACCDSSELKSVGIASVQIVDEEGRVLDGDLKGVEGLKELSSVVVTGTVAENSTQENLVVNAERIHVLKP